MLKCLLVVVVGFSFISGKCQSLDSLLAIKISQKIDTLYFPFYNGIQMIEVDHIWFRDRQLTTINTVSYPKIFTEHTLNLNEFFFRDRNGKIIKAFNTNQSLQSLNKHFENQPITEPKIISHKSRLALNKKFNQFENHYKIVSYVRRNRNPNIEYDYKHLPQTYGLIDSLGNVKIPPVYIWISPVNGNILASKNQKWGVMDYEQMKSFLLNLVLKIITRIWKKTIRFFLQREVITTNLPEPILFPVFMMWKQGNLKD